MTRVDLGDCREIMPGMPGSSVDSIVTDPPYELGFMGKKWDTSGVAYDPAVWSEALRVLKPGGYLLAFGGTRTYHRMVCAIEDAGFEIRDSIHWIYGSGFPKSRNLKGEWEGWGTALKPAHEPVVVARKPLEGTVESNVLQHGTGALDIDSCRIPTTDRFGGGPKGSSGFAGGYESQGWVAGSELGRWPANVILGEEVAERHPEWATYFYCSKATKKERESGLKNPNQHPTVKPLSLMRWLVRLVTPPGGVVLDPFAGSGTTLLAALLENCNGHGIESDADYCQVARERISSVDLEEQ